MGTIFPNNPSHSEAFKNKKKTYIFDRIDSVIHTGTYAVLLLLMYRTYGQFALYTGTVTVVRKLGQWRGVSLLRGVCIHPSQITVLLLIDCHVFKLSLLRSKHFCISIDLTDCGWANTRYY